eukprot:159820-Chlamydomonas_euryale.AAC.16
MKAVVTAAKKVEELLSTLGVRVVVDDNNKFTPGQRMKHWCGKAENLVARDAPAGRLGGAHWHTTSGVGRGARRQQSGWRIKRRCAVAGAQWKLGCVSGVKVGGGKVGTPDGT